MFVQRLRILTIAGVAMGAATGARAADYTPPPPPPVYVQPPPAEPCCDSWYLRGFVGAGRNTTGSVDVTAVADTSLVSSSIGDSYFVGAAVGYNWNSWLRFDLSGEYRAKTQLTAMTRFQDAGGGPVALDQYQGNLSSWVVLANAFVDLGTWNCWTPFVGAGIGGAYNMVSDFTDVTPDVSAFGATGSSFGLGKGTSSWSLAWALYAGVSYAVTKSFNIDLTYRYLNYGTAKDSIVCDNPGGGCVDLQYKNLHSNDIMLGLRWTCCDMGPPPVRPTQEVYAPPPVYSPPPQVYTPPPAYSPPLRSRG
jgi:opacity protein-like surface antigen